MSNEVFSFVMACIGFGAIPALWLAAGVLLSN
jgi:hypothetical protein